MEFLLTLLVLALLRSASAYCYTRNGTTITNEAYQPCNNSTSDSQCCGINHSGAGETNVANDVCEDNGLCQNFEPFDGSNEGQQLWWRGGCTDPTWQSPYCLKDVCNGTEYADDNAPVRNCGGDSWCCGEKSCCKESARVFQLASTVGSTSSATSSATPTPTSGSTSTTPTNVPSPSPSSTNASTGGLNTGAKAGIGVGAAAAVILVGVVAFLAFRRKKSKERLGAYLTNAQYTDGPMGVHEQKSSADLYAMRASNDAAPVELMGEAQHAELAVHDSPRELSGRNHSVRGHA